MTRLLASLLFCSTLFGLISCGSIKNIAGKYGSNFATMGFFGTTINLKYDSSLEYIFGGDLIYHHVTGNYKVYDDRVYMVFDKEKLDSNFASGSLFSDTLYRTTYKGEIIAYQRFYYIGHNKLFAAYAQTGKKITRAKRYCKLKKYLFFGTHYYKRRWYLKRII